MKIQKLSVENRARVYALLPLAFPHGKSEIGLVQKLHENGRVMHEWICIHTSRVIAYIAFTNAYQGKELCGLHLAPLAVSPEFQGQGVGAELLHFALRQDAIKEQTLFVLGEPGYFQRFGFEPCRAPVCTFDKENTHFLSLRNSVGAGFKVGYEPEFKAAGTPSTLLSKKRRGR